MVRVTDDLALSPDTLTLYHAADPLLGHLPVLAFHGPSTTANFTHNSSRIQVHIYSPAGFTSFPRLTISPQSDFYGVVTHLPREFQGDDVCRGLAFALYKYFCELPDPLKAFFKREYPSTRGRRPGSATLFGEQHAADLAQAMTGVAPGVTEYVIRTLQAGALQTQHVSNIDLDVVLPPGAISDDIDRDNDDLDDDDDALLDPTLRQYNPAYTPLVKLFGEPVFLPTAKLRRAPSRPSSLNHHRNKTFSRDSKVELRMQLGELVDTEERYVLKLNELVKHVADEFRSDAFTKDNPHLQANIDKLFPRSVDRILQVNAAFMQDLRRVMDDSEEDAVRDLDVAYTGSASSRNMLAANSSNNNSSSAPSKKDPSGALAMAKTFLEWFPKFTDCYQDYIRASQHFPQLLNVLLDASSPMPNSFRERVVQSTGEQVLRSILIEPVQRLPRYSLFIDQIVGCLPITHPALQVMLKARDIITNICSMDDPLDDDEEGDGNGRKSRTINRLRNLVESWPADLEPHGRLILAADFIELSAPFFYDADALAVGPQDGAGLFLLFNDCLVLIHKKSARDRDRDTALNSRDLLREIDKPSPAGLLASMTNAAGGPGSYDFAFGGWHALADVRFTESADGRCIWMTSINDINDGKDRQGKKIKKSSRCFAMQESYETKAARWSEDITKARIEGRFSEAERETPTWTLRSVRLPETSSDGSLNRTLGLHAAVFQEAAEQLIEGRREPAPVRVVFDNHLGTKGAPVGHYGVEVVIEVRTVAPSKSGKDDARLVMNTAGLNGKKYSDDIAVDDFLTTLARRITQLTSTQHSASNPCLVPALIAYHTSTLRALDLSVLDSATPLHDIAAVSSGSSRAEKTRSFLTSSPVKLLSSFLGGTQGGTTANANASTSATTLALTESIYGSMRLQRSQSVSSRSVLSQHTLLQAPTLQHTQSEVSSLNGSIRDRSATMYSETMNGASGESEAPENPLVRLEQTFTGYVAALQSRKGQFVARTLLSRNAPSPDDELSVNVLYNRMNESPFDWDEASADLPADVIFAAFEKFASIAWRDHMGTIITIQALDALQERAIYLQKKVPGDFADFVHYLFSDMAPQNRRAFTALIKLLADLLQGCSDDGDRGALTLAFADVLVAGSAEPAHNYINLLDRLVDDCDRIFEGNGSAYVSAYAQQQQQQLNQLIQLARMTTGSSASGSSSYEPSYGSFRAHKSVTPSLTSNTSSLRRKFGLEGLLRQNSSAGDPAQINAGTHSHSRSQSHSHSRSQSNSQAQMHAHSQSESEREFREREKEKMSMWRSLSKNRHPAPGESASLSKASAAYFVNRSRSIEMGNGNAGAANGGGGFAAYASGSGAFAVPGRRPASRDRPPIAGAFFNDDAASASLSFTSSISSQRPGSSHRPASSHKQLETIGEPADDRYEGYSYSNSQGQNSEDASERLEKLEKLEKRKRRNSLSDLGCLMEATTLEEPLSPSSLTPPPNRIDAPLPPTPLRTTKTTSEKVNASTPRASALAPSKISISPPSLAPPALARHHSGQVPTRPKDKEKENSNSAAVEPLASAHIPPLKPGRPVLALSSASASAAAASAASSMSGSASTSPTRQLPSSPLKSAGTPPSASTNGSRLRLQSPQKLRERLQSEKRAVEEVDASLRSELSRIAQDMARVSSPSRANESLAASVRALEKAVPQRIQDVVDRQASLEYAMEASVRASEAKVRGIDQLYKEATAENELLYEKFNVELAKIVRALKGKGREDKEDLVARLKEQSEETARLKRENARLQREMVSLRALLKEQ